MQTTIVDIFHNGIGCKLVRSGHRYQCRNCMQIFHTEGVISGDARATLRSIASEQALVCPGAPTWLPEGAWTGLPRRLVPQVGVPMYGRCLMHASHTLHFLSGLIYCDKCGAYTSGRRVVLLAKPCPGKVATITHISAWRLTRMRAGHHPQSGATFPSLAFWEAHSQKMKCYLNE